MFYKICFLTNNKLKAAKRLATKSRVDIFLHWQKAKVKAKTFLFATYIWFPFIGGSLESL